MSHDIWDRFSEGASRATAEWTWNLRSLHAHAFQSPIEEVLHAVFIFKATLNGGRPLRQFPSAQQHEAAQKGGPDFYIVPQHQFGPYRADLLVGYYGIGTIKQTSIVVECDGHQWHERTKEQAQKDRERERALNAHVAKVIRFTGSEIYRDPFACADEIIATLDRALFALHGL